MWEKPAFERLEESLADPFNPIGMRMRAAYFLRQEHDEIGRKEVGRKKLENQGRVVNVLSNALKDTRHGSLMRHEVAYVMGQIRDDKSCATLESILENEHDCVMVRHEAAEALAAIGSLRSKVVLKNVMKGTEHRIPELYETCRIAIDVIEWRASGGELIKMPAACACALSPYSSIDPAPPHPLHADLSITELGKILRDPEIPMFERYRAMFSLRNIGVSEAVKQLCITLTTDTSSALLRHEVAYVLGQMQHPDSVDALEQSLRRFDEHCMVRHESAEALGAIEGRWKDVERILKEFSTDDNVIVRESCLVALDAADYWGYSTQSDDLVDLTCHENNIQEKMKESVSSFASQKIGNKVLLHHFNIKS